jgi:hypothetical protein
MEPIKLEIFSGPHILHTQRQVNEWFVENNNVEIIHIGTSSAVTAYLETEVYETVTICLFFRRT